MNTATATDRVKAEIAAIIGEDPDQIKMANATWSSLLKQGVIADLTLRRWRGITVLSLEDIGVPINDEKQLYGELLNLGEKLLLPREIINKLNSIDSGARKNMARHGFQTHWGIFIPATAYEGFKADNAKYKARYMAVRDQIIEQYDEMLDRLLGSYTQAARVAYRRYNKLAGASDDDHHYSSEDDFIDAFVARIRTLIPSKEVISNSFSFEVALAFVPLPSLLAEDEAQADRVRAEAIRDRTIVDAEEERQQMITSMHYDVIDAARRQKNELIDSFLQNIAGQLRSQIYDAVVTIGESVQRNGYLHPRSVVQIKTLVDQVSKLNFFGDADADRMIRQLQEMIIGSDENRSLEEVTNVLRNIAVVTKTSLLALGEAPREARALGITGSPSTDMVRQARRFLNLNVEAGQTPLAQRQTRSL